MDQVAAAGFAAAADEYERARPSWPLAAIDAAFEGWRVDPAAGLVVDLAAGTGRLTAQLAKRCPQLIAIEPLAEMRRHIRDAPARAGIAEQMPLEDASAQAIFVAEAFHWFDRPAALTEIARVLRPGGGLAILWNDPLLDEAQAEGREAFAALLAGNAPQSQGTDRFRSDMREAGEWLEGVGWEHFEPVGRCEIEHEQTLSSEGLVALVGSLSFVGALEPPERERVLGRVREMLAAQGVDEHELRWRCNVYLTKRR